ncbi:MAG TPA: lamin tail domain-containing protein, partial [Gaiellaceae bacterium]|nr:lamin tail domain-containing protein [Gaiellaceae bacterium]
MLTRSAPVRPSATGTFAALLVLALASGLFVSAVARAAHAAVPGQIAITEWMYNPVGSASAEFVEVTNIGGAPVDMTTYSFDDNSNMPESFPLDQLGTLAPGESGLIVEGSATSFRAEWGLAAGVKIAEGNTNNLGRDDEVNIYDGDTLVDRLTYGDDVT